MGNPSGQNPKLLSRGSSSARGLSKSGVMLFASLVLVLMAILSYVVLTRLDQTSKEVSRLSAQVEQSNRKADVASANAASALARATQAAESALQAATQRNQAEQAKAASTRQAQQAVKQAQAAQQRAATAEATAEEYRKEREAELAHLQQVLSQIADTRRTATGLVMTLGSKYIRFDFDKANLHPRDKERLSRIAGILSTVQGFQIYVYGYTDDIGTQEYNLKLSLRRARAVRDYLVANGLNPNIMTAKGYGEADPLVPGSSPQARAVNRRVEIGLVDSTLKPIPPQNQ